MSGPDTRPGELSTQDARKIAAELNAMTKEQGDSQFRTEVLVGLAKLSMEIAAVKAVVESHEKRFTVVQSGMGDTTGTINKILGALIFVAGLGGLVAGISKIVDLLRAQ